jgi:cell division protein FtsI/penicillin-binding protein 2
MKGNGMHTPEWIKEKLCIERKKKRKTNQSAGYFFYLFVALLTARLFFIQILEGEEHTNRVRQQQNDQIVLEEKSGNIIDRNGISFTSAGEIWKLKIIPHTIGFDEKAFEV